MDEPLGALDRRLREELQVNTTCGLSNISFGLPHRHGINAAFIPMVIASGMTSAITNPLHEEVMQGIMAANVVMGHDNNCARWLKRYRQPVPEGESPAEGRGSRRRRRRA